MWESKYWLIFLAPSQRYLGTCVVAQKKGCKDLSEVETKEWVEFGLIVKNWKKVCKQYSTPHFLTGAVLKTLLFVGQIPSQKFTGISSPATRKKSRLGIEVQRP